MSTHDSAPKTIPIGAIDQLKMVKLFHETAWWIVNAQATQTLEASALADDLASNFVHIFWRPTTASVEMVPSPKFDHNVHIYAEQLMSGFLTQLSERGQPGAQVYAQQIHARQVAAQNAILAKIGEARASNARLIEQCKTTMIVLSDTIFVCEVALALGVCVLSFGGAPAIMGASATMQGLAGFGISEGYSMASHVVNNANSAHPLGAAASAKAWFFEPPTEFSHKTAAAGFAVTAGMIGAHNHIEAQRKLIKSAGVQIKGLNAQLGEKISLIRRAQLTGQKIAPTITKLNAMDSITAMRTSRTRMERVGKGFAVVQLAADWMTAWAALKERDVEIDQ